MLKPTYALPDIPPVELETVPVLKALAKTNRALVEYGFANKHQSGRSNDDINTALVRLFLDTSGGQ